MIKDNLNIVFKKLHHDFDIETPNQGHQSRFLKKLKTQNQTQVVAVTKAKRYYWKPLLGIAASMVLLIVLAYNFNRATAAQDLSHISKEMANTQHFFTAVIAEELEKVDSERTPETETLINDAMIQLQTLEEQYLKLKLDLAESGNDKRVIHAMIDNYWNRINILKTVLENIEGIKTIKLNTNETITIL